VVLLKCYYSWAFVFAGRRDLRGRLFFDEGGLVLVSGVNSRTGVPGQLVEVSTGIDSLLQIFQTDAHGKAHNGGPAFAHAGCQSIDAGQEGGIEFHRDWFKGEIGFLTAHVWGVFRVSGKIFQDNY
jgi:hypothetical protein